MLSGEGWATFWKEPRDGMYPRQEASIPLSCCKAEVRKQEEKNETTVTEREAVHKNRVRFFETFGHQNVLLARQCAFKVKAEIYCSPTGHRGERDNLSKLFCESV